MQSMRNRLSTTGRRGFTLVEMMIAMALVGVLTALIYGLFIRTSDALVDVEGMSKALDQARFGIDHVRSDLNNAGAHMTPNAKEDPWFFVPPDSDLTVHGIMGYDGWQNDDSIYDDLDAEIANRNPRSQFSGVIILGSFNVPANLKVSFPGGPDDALNHTNADKMILESTESGIDRLLGYDPFDLAARDGIDFDDYGTSGVDLRDIFTHEDSPARVDASLLRVTNMDGFSQVARIDTDGANEVVIQNRHAVNDDDSGAGMITGTGDVMDLPVVGDLHFTGGDEPTGFDPHSEPDVRYDAALIDAYWYYVQPAADDPMNFQLVRQRLDANTVVEHADQLSSNSPADAGNINTVGPAMVVAEHVVDFRIWFSCDGEGDNVGGDWVPDTDDCITDDPTAAASEPELARFGHIRLSTRTETQNSNRPHYTVEAGWEGFEDPGDEGGQMRTYDVVPQAEGSAAVVTTQTSVELTNFAMRNVVSTRSW